jgi:uroporphyrinogen decarboxylase
MREMMDYLADFWIRIYEKVALAVKIDMVHIWEDMAGKNGTLISPRHISEFMVPQYRKVKQFVDKHGIPVFSGDSDGNVNELVPLLHEAGVNRYIPFEVAAGNDIREFRKRFPKLCIVSGLDKRVLPLGREGWQGELNKAREVLRYPGYEPSVDHGVPPDVSWKNYYDFHMELKEVIYG